MALTKVKASNLTLTTPSASSNDTSPATTAYVTTALANMVDSAPSTLNTLNELAAALGDDANFSTTVTNSIAGKLPLAGGTISASGDTPLIITTTNSNGPHMRFQVSGNNRHFVGSGTGIGGMGDADDLALRAYDNFYIGTGNSSTKRLTILSSGNVGIGTSSPNALLHIKTADPATNQAVIDFRNPTYGIFAQTNSISSRGNTLEFIASDYNNNSATTHNVLTMRPEGNVGIGTDGPIAPLTINNNLATTNSPSDIYVKNPSAQYTDGDPGAVYNAGPDGILVTADDSRTDGPNKMGLVLYNDNNTAGAFSPMLLFAKRETGSSAYRSALAGIYAKAPLGTGNSDSWIDGQLHFATAGAASSGIKSRMIIDKEGKVVIGPGNTTPDSLLHLEDSSHTAITIQAGTNSSASLRLKNDAQDWDVNTQTNDNFAVYNQTSGTQPFTITPSGYVQTNLNPAFRARAKSGQVYSSNWQKVLYDGAVTQRGSAYASSRFTAPVDGWYQFNAQFNANNNADIDGTLSLWINGSSTDLAGSSSMSNTGANYDAHVVSGCCYLAATHYVEVYRYSSVSTTTRSSEAYGGWFSGFLIG